jgi:hypothetical protein
MIRGERFLNKIIGVNLNAVAQTVLFTLPASGFNRCRVSRILIDNYSIAATTASISFGLTGTPTDWAATAVNANAAAAKFQIISNTAALSPNYAPGAVFVANVTIAQGAPATCDMEVYGYID